MSAIIALAAYAALMILVTIAATKKSQTALEFHVADRKIGWVKSALSIAATWIWAPSLFVSAERAYTQGLVGLFWFTVPNVLCLIIFVPFAMKIREKMPDGITLAGYMASQYGPGAKRAYLFQLSALSVFSTGVNLLAGGMILKAFLGWPAWVITIVLALIAFSYSQFSGIKASIVTDVVQMFFIMVPCLVFVVWAIQKQGMASIASGLSGPNGAFGSLFSNNGRDVFIAFGLSATIGLTAGPFGDQNFWQRAFAVRKDRVGHAFILGALIFAIMPLAMGSLGFIARGSGFAPQNVGMVNLELVKAIFPSWTIYPFVFMIFSGLLSTVDSNLCAMASLTTDITDSQNVNVGRVAMLVNLALGIAIANIPGITITSLFLFYGTLRASTLAPTVLSLSGFKLRNVAIGVAMSLCVGLPIFAWGSIANMPLVKAGGSLITVCLSGAVSLIGGKLDKKRA